MEIASFIINIISMIGTIISAIMAFSAKSEVKKMRIEQKAKGDNNHQTIGDIQNDR